MVREQARRATPAESCATPPDLHFHYSEAMIAIWEYHRDLAVLAMCGGAVLLATAVGIGAVHYPEVVVAPREAPFAATIGLGAVFVVGFLMAMSGMASFFQAGRMLRLMRADRDAESGAARV